MAAKGLFKLFQRYKDLTLKDPETGAEATIRIRQVTQAEHLQITDELDEYRVHARGEVYSDTYRNQVLATLKELELKELIEELIFTERPAAIGALDLAPGVEGAPEEKAEDKQKKALERWEENRKKELEEQPRETLELLILDKRLAFQLMSRVNNKYADLSLALCALDPATCGTDPCVGEPYFHADPRNENNINNLMPQVRGWLVTTWLRWIQELSAEQVLRRQTKDPNFLSSGDSQKKSEDSPGETTETQ